MSVRELRDKLRKRVQDDRWSVPSLQLACLDRMATDALLTIDGQWLRTTILNGSAPELRIDLTDPATATLAGLVDHLTKNYAKHYRVVADQEMMADHASVDLEPCQDKVIPTTGLALRVHRFSDEELEQFLQVGIQRHNPSYTLDTFPSAEEHWVLLKAHVAALHVMATNAAKRRGLTATTDDLLKIAREFETTYSADARRLANAIAPVRSNNDQILEGDVVVGEVSRFSLRTGYVSNSAAKLRLDAPQLLPFVDRDIQDFSVTVRWRRSTEPHAYSLELWRDTQPEVRRSRDVSVYPTTSKLVWSSRNTSATREQEGWGTTGDGVFSAVTDGMVVPEASHQLSAFTALEPDQVYYYRLYLVDVNGEWAASDVESVKTRQERALFSRTAPVDVRTGPRAGGTVLTITGTGFTANQPKVQIGGRDCTSVVVVSDTTLTCASPASSTYAPAAQDIVLVSMTGLRDVLHEGWRYA